MAVLLLAACGQSVPELPRLAPDATVLAFGDSLTHGTGAARQDSFPAVLERRIGRTVVNAGVPGETTTEGRERLPRILDREQPDLVLLCLGGNDFLRQHPEERTRRNLRHMIETIRARGVPVVLLEVPQPKLLLRAHPMYEDLAEAYDVPLLEDTLTDVLGKSELRSDRIHPNAEGYARVAESLEELLRDAGAIQ